MDLKPIPYLGEGAVPDALSLSQEIVFGSNLTRSSMKPAKEKNGVISPPNLQDLTCDMKSNAETDSDGRTTRYMVLSNTF